MKSFVLRCFIILIFSIYSFVCNFSQNPNKDISIYKEYFEEGLYFFKKKDYNEALYFFLKLLEYQPDNAHYNFKVGETYLNIPGKEAKAIPYLEKAVNKIVPKNKYKENSFEEYNTPLHALFYLGIAYRINNQLDEALKAYEEFINSPYFIYNYNQMVVENEIKACERAKIIYDNPIKVNITLLNKDINTSASELFPIVNDDETVLIFVRKLKFYDAIFYTTKDNNNVWKEPRNINEEIGSDGDLYPSCISKDGKVLYLIKHTMKGTDVYVSYLDNDRWTKAILIGKPISTNAEENYVFVNNDDNIMLFCSDRFGGYGGMDIYISKKNSKEKWERPKKLPKILNSQYDEARPYLINNGNNYKLYFSSQGFYNMGGYDIFVSNFNKEKNIWSEPKNIGYPINDTGDNVFFTPARSGKVFYVSKMNPETENEDIYRIEIVD